MLYHLTFGVWCAPQKYFSELYILFLGFYKSQFSGTTFVFVEKCLLSVYGLFKNSKNFDVGPGQTSQNFKWCHLHVVGFDTFPKVNKSKQSPWKRNQTWRDRRERKEYRNLASKLIYCIVEFNQTKIMNGSFVNEWT